MSDFTLDGDELRGEISAYLVAQADNSPRYATFGCQNFRDWLEHGDGEVDPGTGIDSSCECDFVADLPPLGLELPSCPRCGGPSLLVDVLRAA